ncbi:MAG: hypothetical protein Harvfovirus8_26 [Harvfovirus sp.]|uniref:Uncharacterized protein n=1 Tax=Harvfovirus sp. TaxID=2487768 RepID=A0A3G5A0Y8_9VIRU|nr:MAG: hypothetical protein Harvfovirus8_26 [Harvfovirus sp.]
MGGSHSSKQVSDVLNESLQSIMQNVMQSATSDIQNVQDIYQVNSFTQGPNSTIDCRPGKFELNQLNDSIFDFKFVDQITNDMSSAISNKLQQDISTKQNQVQKIVRDMTIGGSTDDQMISNIINRVNQIVNSSVNTQTLNKILRQTTSIQGNNIVINGNIFGNDCKITQANKLQFALMANSLTNNITKSILEDEVLGRIVNDISQSQEIVQLGVTTMISAVASLVLAIGASISMVGTGAGGPIVSLIFKVFSVLLTIFLVYLILAYWQDWWPFRNGHWGCERDVNGIVTGKCVQIDKNDPDINRKGPFTDEKDCLSAISKGQACFQYWGCDKDPITKLYNGACMQFKGPLEGPYKTKEICEIGVADPNKRTCKLTSVCGVDKDGNATGKCQQFNQDDFPLETVRSETYCTQHISDCAQIWACTRKKGNKCNCEQYPLGSLVANPKPDKAKCDEACNSDCKGL